MDVATTNTRTQLTAWIPARVVQFLLDIVVLVSALTLAYLVRFDFEVPHSVLRQVAVQIPLVVGIQLATLSVTGVYAFIWRYIGLSEVRAFGRAALLSVIPLIALRLGMPDRFESARVPLSIILMDAVFAFGGVLALRVSRRVLYERYEKRKLEATRIPTTGRVPALLVGAGRAGIMVLREILGRGDMNLDVLGFVDDDPEKTGSSIQGARVLGTTQDLARLVRELGIQQVVITIAQASRQDIRRIVQLCEACGVKVRIMPGLYEILEGRVEVSRIRDVQIEDLLGREQVQLDEAELSRFLAGKRVMVTGAGGSIGSELCRQVARYAPGKLILAERGEPALFQIDCELREKWSGVAMAPLLVDVGDVARLKEVFAEHRPEVVIHAAAHKHVPLMEGNPLEAIKNNVLATHRLAEIAGESGVEVFVLISTDKAVRPTSVMGASKRVAELVVQDLDRKFATRYVAVRFGNVLGSAGSVIPIFREQIRKGGPLQVTHPEMVRYFMTIPEAAQLVLQAGAMGEGGEIFVLDMGEPVQILDLARDMIRLSGFKPHEDIEIVFTGVRPGEKLFEELETDGEHIDKTKHPKIFIGRIARLPEESIQAALQRFQLAAAAGDPTQVRRHLAELLPESRLTGVDPVRPAGSDKRDRHSTPEIAAH